MAVIKCKMCGGDLNLVEGASTAECEYCGSVQTVPKVDDEKKLTLFARANRLRAACEFDKAAGIYETIVADFPEEAEAYWGLVLCKFGIEYVDDPGTAKKIPTCHRSSFESVMDDSDLDQALENADTVARKVYREEAKQIEELRKGIIAVSANEEPYDIFICYKETDENGERTLDSVLAQDMYDVLTDKGYRVFFARITLEDKLGMEYEPYIFAALNSAKIMLVFGTDYEYFNAVWVKNEWGRYLKLMAKDKDKHLIPCYKGIDAYDMPKEFAKLQAQDLGKVGATQDLLRGISKILPKQAEEANQTVFTAQTANAGTAPLLERAYMFLEDGEWNEASAYCERVLDMEPKNAWAYLGKLMAQLHAPTQDALAKVTTSFEENNYYIKALRYADTDMAIRLASYLESAKRNVEIAEKEKIYQQAVTSANQQNILGYRDAISLFSQISGYKDAEEWIDRCRKETHKRLEEICAEEQAERERAERIKRAERAKQEAEERRLAEIGTGRVVLLIKGGGGLLGAADGTTYKYEILREGRQIETVLVEAGKKDQAKAVQMQSGEYTVRVTVYGYADKSLSKVIHSAGPLVIQVRKNQQVTVIAKRSLFSSNILSIG